MALYRKYRPATFAEVVGQEHVTEPLSAALEAGRVNHAYLFSGPRGCGKTSSARILARSLNCAEGPTATPCGVCRSCVSLAPGGSGNLDVVELDAASHGGVDDTRDLRDKAFYTPAESRYRVFIVDEAHMITNAGFNALLKIVEEPPEHLIFVFATTEPEKVIATIRSRTHHYPFRLLPPHVMRGLLDSICADEGVTVEDAVFPLVIRAGGGSPRDTLSVLDQLLAGAGSDGIAYERALALLGATDVALIDEAVDALSVDDGAALFQTVNRLVEAGHDPRGFASDLLERMRDLIVLRQVPDAAERGLVDAPGGALDRMRDEAERVGPATLTRYAEVIHESLNAMRGATAPRLLLEVMCARLLLPAAADDTAAMLQRIEKLEQGVRAAGAAAPGGPAQSSGGVGVGVGSVGVGGVGVGGGGDDGGGAAAGPGPAASGGDGAPRFVRPSQRAREERAREERAEPRPDPQRDPEEPQSGPREAQRDLREAQQAPSQQGPSPHEAATPEPHRQRHPEPQQEPQRQRQPEEPAATDETMRRVPAERGVPDAGSRPDAAAIRAAWSEVHKALRKRSNVVAAMFSSAAVKSVDGDAVVLTHPSPPLAARLAEPHNAEQFRQAISTVFGGQWRLVVEPDSGPAAAGGPSAVSAPGVRAPEPEASGIRAPEHHSSDRRPAEHRSLEREPPGERMPERRGGLAGRRDPDGTDVGRNGDAATPQSGMSPEQEAAAEDEMMADAAAGPGEADERRDPEEAAIELLRGRLGAHPIDG